MVSWRRGGFEVWVTVMSVEIIPKSLNPCRICIKGLVAWRRRGPRGKPLCVVAAVAEPSTLVAASVTVIPDGDSSLSGFGLASFPLHEQAKTQGAFSRVSIRVPSSPVSPSRLHVVHI